MLAHSITTRRPQMLKWVSWARYACTAYKCIKVESFLCPCLSYLMMSTIEYCIYLTVNITMKQSSQSISVFFAFFLLDNIIWSVQNFSRLCLLLVFFLFFFLVYATFSARLYLLNCVLTTARCHRASSFDINRAAVCHFHISSWIRTRNELSSICFSN